MLLRKYNQSTYINFALVEASGSNFKDSASFTAGDVQVIKDRGTPANATNTPAYEGNGIYSLQLTAAELSAANIQITVIDSGDKTWADQSILIDTYGNASAEHAFDLDTALADATVGTCTTNTDMRGTDNAFLAASGYNTQVNVNLILEDTDELQTNQGNWATATGFSTFNPATDTVARVTLVDSCGQITDSGVSLTNIPWNASWDAEVQSEVQDAIEVNHLDHLLAVDYDPSSKPGVSTALFNELVENDGGVSRFTANALELGPVGSGGSSVTESGIAFAVWEEILTENTHNVATSAGKRLREVSAVPVYEGAVDGGTATTASFDTTLTGYGDNFFNDSLITVELSEGNWQSRPVTDYSSSNGTFTVDEAFTSAPSNGSKIAVRVTHIHSLIEIRQELDNNSVKLSGILEDTAEIGTAGAGLTNVPWNASWDAEVQSEVQDAIEVNHLDHLFAADYDPASKPGVSTALLNEIFENDGGVSRLTANALEQAPNSTDWSSTEKEQIRYRLGIDGTSTAPTSGVPVFPVTFSAEEDIYYADINLNIDDANSKDEYRVRFKKNDSDVKSGITSAKITVYKCSDGSELFANQSLTDAGGHLFKFDATTTNRISAREAYEASVSGVIDSSTRTWSQLFSRDN